MKSSRAVRCVAIYMRFSSHNVYILATTATKDVLFVSYSSFTSVQTVEQVHITGSTTWAQSERMGEWKVFGFDGTRG